jgi:HK97 family phage portal protein
VSMWRRDQRAVSLPNVGAALRGRSPLPAGAVQVSAEVALRHSAVWAALRIHADMVSMFPVDVYRKVDGQQVEVKKPSVLEFPGGPDWPYSHWTWASQHSLHGVGNAVGLIVERDGMNLPARIDLVPNGAVSIRKMKDWDEHRYVIDGKEYRRAQVWHERQYPVPGLPVGMSPLGYAAWSVSEGLTMQKFALDWFGSGVPIPKMTLQNTAREMARVGDNEARRVKDRFKATVATGDVFVHGKDWELNLAQGEKMGMEWLDGRRHTVEDVARFLSTPLDLVEAAIAGSSVTYQNAMQRNLQFLIIHLQPAMTRRELAFSNGLVSRPRYVKMNPGALLRMTPDEQAKVIHQRIEDRTLAPSEARALYDLPPLTSEQITEFETLFPSRKVQAPGAQPPPADQQPVGGVK